MKECKVHKFVKFDEDRIFCERCGLFMLAARQAPVYIPTIWPYPYTGTWQPYPHWYYSTTSVGGTTTTAGVPMVDSVTYNS